jgi:GTP-binding protein EngB required for normal cell division
MFGENQNRYFISQLRYIDELLGSALQELDPAVDPNRVFDKAVHDATLAQRKTLGDFVAQLRFSLRRFMQANELRDQRHLPSGLWAFRTAVSSARIAAEELRPKFWSGYGTVTPQAAAAGERFAAELKSILARIDGYLIRGDGVELKDRLAQLEALTEEAPLLADLERLISSHGLIELRAPLELLIERARMPRFEIAIFGRVSSGKSSLLNWWVGQAVLPTGVIPVTSVPTHITHGEAPHAYVSVAGGREIIEVPLMDLPKYVTEELNPGNAKQLLKIEIKVPAERLEAGIELVDTPGLGSLATAGAAQTLEYLPRCDLGILLIEACAPFSREDIDVTRALLAAGSEVSLTLSKADQMSAADLARARTYAETQIAAALGVSQIIRPVSTLGSCAALTKTWFDAEILPRLARHRDDARLGLRRKIAVLRESVVSAIDSRLNQPLAAPGTSAERRGDEDPDGIAQARLEIERVSSTLRGLRIAHGELAVQLSEAVRRELARGWVVGESGSTLRERVERAARQTATGPGDAVALCLQQAHEQLTEVLRHAAQCPPEGLRPPRGRPILELPVISPAVYLKPHWLPRWEGVAALIAGTRLSRAVIESLETKVLVHAEALSRWGLEYVEEVTREFNAAIAPAERARRTSDGFATPMELEAARQDLERLRRWPTLGSST